MSVDDREKWITHIPRQTSLLNPGDILINSGWWWHDVQSIGTHMYIPIARTVKDSYLFFYYLPLLLLGERGSPQVSVAGRIKNVPKTFTNSPILTLNASEFSANCSHLYISSLINCALPFPIAVITRILAGKSEEQEFELELEDGIVKSWTKDCEKRGRTDCITPP
jgi:hypothetical protein